MVHQHRTTAALIAALALTASLAPTASADPGPLARAEAALAAAHGRALVRPNPDNQTATAATPCSPVCSGGAGSAAPTVVRVVGHSGGFDWGDAGIGAGATLVLLGIGLTGTRAATNSRQRHTGEQRAIVAG